MARHPMGDLLQRITGLFVSSDSKRETMLDGQEKPTLDESVEQARKDWLAAQEYFESVSDPELVDHAIHLVTAAEKKYMYLLKKAQEQGNQAEGSDDQRAI